MRDASKPVVSVVIPTRNRADLLGQALASVYAQEEAGGEFELEVVVVDDASSDNTPEVIRAYTGVHHIRLEEKRGAAAARNVAIRASKGTYVAFLDDDDVWLPHRLRHHVSVLLASPEIGFVYGQQIIQKSGRDGYLWPDALRAPSGYVFDEFLLEDFVSINTLLVRRTSFEKAGYFDESRENLEHIEFALRLSFYFPAAFVPGPVAIQNLSGRPVSSYWKGKSYGKAMTAIVEKALALLPHTPEYTEVKRRARRSVLARTTQTLGNLGDIGRLRGDILTMLQEQPWFLSDAESRALLRQGIGRVAVALMAESVDSLNTAREWCSQISGAVVARGLRERLALRRFLAEVWVSMAIALREGRNRDDRAAGWAAARAIVYDPIHLKRTVVLWTLLRAIFAGRRWDPAFDHLRRLLRSIISYREGRVKARL